MKFINEINERIVALTEKDAIAHKKHRHFFEDLEIVIKNTKDHLKEITAQLSDYDKHDETHSEKVLENMEFLIGESGAKNLSLYELILLYASAYLHDAGMALPKGEYDFLCGFEGTDKVNVTEYKLDIRNDLKPPKTLLEIRDIIINNKNNIYVNFELAKEFIFYPQNEEDLYNNLAKEVKAYQEFRNQFSDKFQELLENTAGYKKYSEEIRTEYIRSTHHTRVEQFILTLVNRFAERNDVSERLGKGEISHIIKWLASICRSHGENFSFVFNKLPHREKFDQEHINLKYISSILRLADVLHFSADRAPRSLRAEKCITDKTSSIHWDAKAQDLEYRIIQEDNKTLIQFNAFCDSPDRYYFIHDKIDDMDIELDNYHSYIKDIEVKGHTWYNDYALPLCKKVDRNNIKADDNVFTPDKDLKFSLSQSKILELLMGVQLYKDKYLCLRELYQNSLDACKCMIEQNKIDSKDEQFFIKFGLGEEAKNGITYKYIYWHDNGTGMTKDIVKNYLLQIGNSYYKSKNFMQQNTSWNMGVNPTSQFGIGILSCYMIADRIEITTRHYTDNEAFCFSLDGISERFYYLPVNHQEAETIGEHGTIVKLFLKPDCAKEINNDIPEKLHYIIHGMDYLNLMDGFETINQFKKSLFFLVNSVIGFPKSKIKVLNCTDNKKEEEIIPWDKMFNFYGGEDVSCAEIATLGQNVPFYGVETGDYKEMIRLNDYIKHIRISISNDDIELYTHVSLPLLNCTTYNYNIFIMPKFIWRHNIYGEILVDGVLVSGSHLSSNKRFKSWNPYCIINFIGINRPLLSIDRNTIVALPDKLYLQYEDIITKLILELKKTLNEHLKDNNILPNSKLAFHCLRIIITMFPSIMAGFIKSLKGTKAAKIVIKDFTNLTGLQTVYELITNNKFLFNHFNMSTCTHQGINIILGKLIPAKKIEVFEDNVTIISKDLISIPKKHADAFSHTRVPFLIRADTWEGKYKEYDLVSTLWPIVPSSLFNLIDLWVYDEFISPYENRIKEISSINKLRIIADLDIVKDINLNPKYDFFISNRQRYNNGKVQMDKAYVLYAYIPPRKLNEHDQNTLKSHDYDHDYMKRVKEGWSILFFEGKTDYISAPGIMPRSEIYKKIHDGIKQSKRDNIHYYDLNGKIVF